MKRETTRKRKIFIWILGIILAAATCFSWSYFIDGSTMRSAIFQTVGAAVVFWIAWFLVSWIQKKRVQRKEAQA